MDRKSLEVLVRFAETFVTQAATLNAWQKVSGIEEIAHMEMQHSYAAQVKKSRPALQELKDQVQGQPSEEAIFDSLLKLLDSVTTPAPGR